MSFTPPALTDITLAILAGGQGTRMGMPKSLIRIEGQLILEFLLDRLRWPGPTALITAPGREHPPGWQRFTEEYVDPVAGLGPLRGLLTTLEHATTEWVVAITVDMPRIGREQIEELLRARSEGELGAMFARCSESGEQITEPFPIVLRTAMAGPIKERIERGRLSVTRLIEEPGFNTRLAPEHWKTDVWTNLNRPEDLNIFLAQL